MLSDATGEYGAAVVSGANRGIDAAAIGEAWAPLWACRVLLLQSEVDEAVNRAAAQGAKAQGAMVLLNAAPARAVDAGTLTLGSGGVLVQPRQGTLVRIAPLAVDMVSSHGAGDCFCGALAARLAAGDDLDSACRFANAAAGAFVSLAEGDRARIDAAMVGGRMVET